MFDLEKFEVEVNAWSRENFSRGISYQRLLGIVEELGELAHHFLKREQSIRMDEDHEMGIVDAIGDIVIFLIGYCQLEGISICDAIYRTWELVKGRKRETWGKGEGGGVLPEGVTVRGALEANLLIQSLKGERNKMLATAVFMRLGLRKDWIEKNMGWIKAFDEAVEPIEDDGKEGGDA